MRYCLTFIWFLSLFLVIAALTATPAVSFTGSDIDDGNELEATEFGEPLFSPYCLALYDAPDSGQGNTAFVLQKGTNNNINIGQVGSHNSIVSRQLFSENSADLTQRGSSNRLTLNQLGVWNHCNYEQQNSHNTTTVNQLGVGNTLSGSQLGHATIRIWQFGGATATIDTK